MQQADVPPQQWPLLFFLVFDRPHQIGRHHGCNQSRDNQREQDGHGHSHAELLEILPDNAAHEGYRHEHRDDGETDGNDGEADFVGGFHGGTVGCLAHADVSRDVFYFDNGIIDQNARGQGDAEKGNQIEREAQHVHGPEGRNG